MPDIEVLLLIVKRIVNSCLRDLENRVVSFPHISKEDRLSYSWVIALSLETGHCKCKSALDSDETYPEHRTKTRIRCFKPGHTLSSWDPDGPVSLEEFVAQAIRGSNDYKPLAIAGGMLFPFLQDDWGLACVKVEFRICSLNHFFEGTQCPYDHKEDFDPAKNEIRAKQWLVIAGAFAAASVYWACGAGRAAHYYPQRHCKQLDGEVPIKHDANDNHDCCPLEDCDRYGAQHGQNGTLLWRRAITSSNYLEFVSYELDFDNGLRWQELEQAMSRVLKPREELMLRRFLSGDTLEDISMVFALSTRAIKLNLDQATNTLLNYLKSRDKLN